MFDLDQLRATEDEVGIRYPAGFWSVAGDLVRVFAATCPGVRAATPADLIEARVLGLSASLVPFACEPQPAHTDFYCCNADGGPTVAVFAVHSVVAQWPTFADFLTWVRRVAADQRQAEPGAAADGGP